MAALTVYRVQRNGNYTVMANYHLRDRALSLKAKGLFSLLLSLPDDWDFSLPGLVAICKEGMDAIRDAVKELEALGYIIRSRVRNAKGRLESAAYELYEQPQTADFASHPVEYGQESHTSQWEEPVQGQPAEEKPIRENPTLVFPVQGDPQPINNPSYPVTPKIKNKKIYNDHYPDQSDPSGTLPMTGNVRPFPVKPWLLGSEQISGDRPSDPTEKLLDIVRKNVGYAALAEEYGREQMDEMVSIIVGVLASHRMCFRFGRDVYPSGFVKKQFFDVNSHHIEYVFHNLKNNGSNIHDPKAYLMTCIFNATLTMSNHMDAKVRHDVYNDEKVDKQRAEEASLDRAMEAESAEFWEEIKREINRTKGIIDEKVECAVPVCPADYRVSADRLVDCYAG